MRQAMHRHLSMTQVISFGFLTALLSLFQPIPPVSAQQPTGLLTHETSGAGIQGQRVENLNPNRPYPTTVLERKDTLTSNQKPHRLIRKPQNAPVASVEPAPAGTSPLQSLPTPPPVLQSDNESSQPKESPSLYNRSAGAAVPLATMSVAPSIATATGSAALGTTSAGITPLAAAGAGNSNGSGGGRSMSKLASEMPGLTQLISPPSAPGASTNPAIGASPPSLSFTAQQGGANPSAQMLSISNTGGGTLTWSASENSAWLTVSPASGTGNGAVTLTAATAGLSVGTQTATITLTATGASPVTVPVSFIITAAPIPPAIGASPTSFSFTATQGAANPTPQLLSIRNPGGATLTWSITDDQTWLTFNATSGTTTTETDSVTLSVNTNGLQAATHSATITVTATGASNTPQTIPVTLILNAPATSSATLTWNPNTEPDLASYRIYRSTQQGVYGAALTTVPAGTVSYTATGLPVGQTYYFTITAVDSSNNESPSSNEVLKPIP